MTGEAFEAMRRHTILSALMPEGKEAAVADDRRWFLAGADRSGEPGGLLHHLFSVRADGLFGHIPSEGLADYLSGILIGHEIRAMSKLFETGDPILLIASDQLSRSYLAALSHLGLAGRPLDPEPATVAGLAQVLAAIGSD
jgi:2-dehydro-3-deoxygalactonokinase